MLEKYFQNNAPRNSMLKQYSEYVNLDKLEEVRETHLKKLFAPTFSEIRELIESLPEYEGSNSNLLNDCLELGSSEYFEQNKEKLELILEKLIPWRTGPFNFCGKLVDAEWQSFFKWQKNKTSTLFFKT